MPWLRNDLKLRGTCTGSDAGLSVADTKNIAEMPSVAAPTAKITA